MSDPREPYKLRLDKMKPALEAVLDPLCVVNHKNEVIYANLAMKGLLGLTGKDLKEYPVFCDRVKLPACEKECQIQHAIDSQEMLRLDETPSTKITPKGHDKMRAIVKVVPFTEDQLKGAIITLRDTTGEVLLQAKYHKILQILQEGN